MTDNKALAETRYKFFFNNNRINKWIEKIQEFDFTFDCVKGEMMPVTDALSRQYESVERSEEEKVREGKKVKAGTRKEVKTFV